MTDKKQTVIECKNGVTITLTDEGSGGGWGDYVGSGVMDKPKQMIGFDRLTYKREDGSEVEIIPGTKADAERMGIPYLEPKQTVIEREVDNWQADQWQPNADGPGPRIYPEAAFEAGIRRGIEMCIERLKKEEKEAEKELPDGYEDYLNLGYYIEEIEKLLTE